MKHARADYDAIQPWPTKRPHIARLGAAVGAIPGESEHLAEPIIPDDEPVLLIRGQDLAAIPTARAWCEAARDLGADPELIECVERHIERIREWQATVAEKVPDAPAGFLR